MNTQCKDSSDDNSFVDRYAAHPSSLRLVFMPKVLSGKRLDLIEYQSQPGEVGGKARSIL